MHKPLPHLARRCVHRIGWITHLSILLVWIVLYLVAGVFSGMGPTKADSVAWALLSLIASMVWVIPILLVSLGLFLMLWHPVFRLLGRVGMELPHSAMVSTALLLGSPVLIGVMQFGRLAASAAFVVSIPLVLGVWMSRRCSFEVQGEMVS